MLGTSLEVELHHRRLRVVLARRGEWGGLCRLGGRQRVRAERQHRRQAVELRHRRLCGFLARRGEWGGLCRLGRRQRVRAERQHRRPAVELHHRRCVDSSPAVANGVVYVGSDDDNVYALNASTGAKLWSYTTGGYVDSSPAVANGVVYVGSATATCTR